METNEKEMWERLTENEQSCKSLHKRVDRMEEVVDSMRDMVIEIKHMREDLNAVTSKMNEIETKPAKRWEAIISAVIGAVAGGFGTWLISLLIGG